MSLTSTSNRVTATGDGVTTLFNYNKQLYDSTHLQVYLDSVLQTTGYTVGGVPGTSTNVTFSAAPASGVQVLMLRVVPLTQLSVYAVGGAFPAATTEKNFDLVVMGLQQFDDTTNRTLRQPVTDTTNIATIPVKASRASMYLAFDVNGDPVATTGTSETPNALLKTGGNLTGGLNEARGSVVQHATTMDLFAITSPGTLDGTGSAVTITDIVDAPQAGPTRRLYPIVGTVITHGATFSVTGNASYTTLAGDCLEFEAVTISTFKVRIIKQGGTAVVDASPPSGVLIGGKFVVSMAGSAVTIAIKTDAGNDPSLAIPVKVYARSSSATDGAMVLYTLASALSLTITTGATMGTLDGVASRIYVGAIAQTSSIIDLYAITTLSGISLYLPPEHEVITTTTANATSDSAQVPYSSLARTTEAHRVLGYFECTQAAAGVWLTAASKVQQMGVGVPRTGAILRSTRSQTGAVATGTTVLPVDDTIPQNTEGDQYLTASQVVTSGLNLLQVTAVAFLASNTEQSLTCALFRGATANALAAVTEYQVAGGVINFKFVHVVLAGTAGSTTFNVRAGAGAGTISFNGSSGGRLFGGVAASSLLIEEVMA